MGNPAPVNLDTNASFQSIVSRLGNMDTEGSMTAEPGILSAGGPYQPPMTPTQTVNNGNYKTESAPQHDPDWNDPKPPNP